MSSSLVAVGAAAATVGALHWTSMDTSSAACQYFSSPLRIPHRCSRHSSPPLRPQYLRLRGAGGIRVRVRIVGARGAAGVRRSVRRPSISSVPSNYSSTIVCASPNSTYAQKDRQLSHPGLSYLGTSGICHKSCGHKQKMAQHRLHFRKIEAGGGSVYEDVGDNGHPRKTRRVVEHVALFKMNDSLTDELESEMMDNLWSLQYRVKNILCSSVGRLVKKTPEGYTHAFFSRFPTKQALDEYMENPIRWRVSQDLVMPYYDDKVFVDFEADVDDDIETIFRRGDDFQEGLEHMMFFRLKENVSPDAVKNFLKAASALPQKYNELVQLTIGTNMDSQSKGTIALGLVARLPSESDLNKFNESLQKEPSWLEGMELFQTAIVANFPVTPVGKRVM